MFCGKSPGELHGVTAVNHHLLHRMHRIWYEIHVDEMNYIDKVDDMRRCCVCMHVGFRSYMFFDSSREPLRACHAMNAL